MIDVLKNLFCDGQHTYSTLVTLLGIVLAVIIMFEKIKYACLEKAAAKVAEVEGMENLTGEQKFALVLLWINQSLPVIFRAQLFQNLISKLIEYAYKNSADYAKKYIKRKTGYDVSALLEKLPSAEQASSDNTKSDASTNSN